MNCGRYRKLAALQVGGDLPERAALRLEAHRADCAACQAFAAELLESQTMLQGWRSAEPSQALMQQVRRSVLAEIQRIGERRSIWDSLALSWQRADTRIAAGLAACGLIAMAIWLALSWPSSPGNAGQVNLREMAEREAMVPNPEPAMKSAPVTKAAQPAERQGTATALGNRSPNARSPATYRVPVQIQSAQVAGGGIDRAIPVFRRIELQTADPGIRIIWLVPASQPARLPAGPPGG